MSVSTSTQPHSYTHTLMLTVLHTHKHPPTHPPTHTPTTHTPTHTHSHTHTSAHTYTHTHSHTHTPTHTHTQSLSTLNSTPLLASYHKHWLSYQKGAKFLDNLFSYFNRVPLRKYRPSVDSVDYALPGLLSIPKVTHTYGDTPVEIRQVS